MQDLVGAVQEDLGKGADVFAGGREGLDHRELSMRRGPQGY